MAKVYRHGVSESRIKRVLKDHGLKLTRIPGPVAAYHVMDRASGKQLDKGGLFTLTDVVDFIDDLLDPSVW